ncbi:hypothetical protein LCGC14_2100420, partial [marine sediment metagenome]
LYYFHCTIGASDLYDAGLTAKVPDNLNRDYWSGMFGYGYGLCFTTHHQWHGEMAKLLGPCRSRTAGVPGHTTFEVWLTGGPYGEGRWALLDHDISTVIFTPDGKRLLGLAEVARDMSSIKKSSKQRGWLVGGLHPSDPGVYKRVKWVGYATGYAVAPPMVNLRAGETLRRYPLPGLEDGKTYVYWGINYNKGGILGPERRRTWVHQPEKLHKATRDAGNRRGTARFANAVYTYKPDFAGGKYRDGVVAESASQVTLEFRSPYVVAATPPTTSAAKERWSIYKPGCTNGLVISGKMTCPVEISTDRGKTWKKAPETKDGMDLTDLVKGHMQYRLRFGAGAKALAGKGVTIRTVCQAGTTIIPRLKAGKNTITYQASGQAVVSGGPNIDQTKVVAGAMSSPTVTLELAAPRDAKAVHVYAAEWVASGSPIRKAKYNIDFSVDGGKTWKPVLKDYRIIQRPPEPDDWQGQSFVAGDRKLSPTAGPVRVRFTNTGRRKIYRAEAHLVYKVANTSPLKVTFGYKDGGELKTASHTYAKSAPGKADTSWTFDAGAKPQTVWVEYAAQ